MIGVGGRLRRRVRLIARTRGARPQGRSCATWENEAFLALKDLGPDKFEIVVPGLSIRAQLPVTVVDKRGTRKQA